MTFKFCSLFSKGLFNDVAHDGEGCVCMCVFLCACVFVRERSKKKRGCVHREVREKEEGCESMINAVLPLYVSEERGRR